MLTALAAACVTSHAAAETYQEFHMNGGHADQATEIKCFAEGTLYQMAATTRDSRMPPQQALDALAATFGQQGFSRDFVKGVVNRVYFDPAFEGAGGEALREQIAVLCLDPNGKYAHPRYTPAQ